MILLFCKMCYHRKKNYIFDYFKWDPGRTQWGDFGVRTPTSIYWTKLNICMVQTILIVKIWFVFIFFYDIYMLKKWICKCMQVFNMSSSPNIDVLIAPNKLWMLFMTLFWHIVSEFPAAPPPVSLSLAQQNL